MNRLLPVLLSLAAIASLAAQESAAKPAAEPKPAAPFVKTDGYPFDTCLVSNEPLGAKAKSFTVEGHTFKTCCGKCQAKIEKDPSPYVAQLEAAVTKAQGDSYALTTCPISGKALNDKAVAVVTGNTLVRLCCGGCKSKLQANPAAAVAKVQEAAFAKQAAKYPAKTCPVSGHDLDENAVAVMHGSTLVKLCCNDCMAKLEEAPNATAAKVAIKDGKGAAETKGEEAKKGDGKDDGKAPSEATPSNGAACCEAGKPAAGCCEAGAGTGCCAGKEKEAAGQTPTPAANGAAKSTKQD
jgi:hypothetical protein